MNDLQGIKRKLEFVMSDTFDELIKTKTEILVQHNLK